MREQDIQPIEYRDGVLRMLDQTLLPHEERYIETRAYRDVSDAIRRLAVRGAPLIGIAAAYGVALAVASGERVRSAAAELAATRPTAVNLLWAIERVLESSDALAEARRIHEEQIAADVQMGELGSELLRAVPRSTETRRRGGAESVVGLRVLTHCNTGALATGGIGTALGVIKTAHVRGMIAEVLVDETRPLLQGARLTAWELERARVPYRIIADGAAAGIIARGDVDAVVVGADRIAANGDTANKVGTYGLALAAHAHGVPFFVIAPVSTIDARTPDGGAIRIEERPEDEVLSFAGLRAAPDGARAANPAFDVTPCALITAIVTERSALTPPFDASISETVAGTEKEEEESRGEAPVVAR
jgi:methylthioribose-1-phosphate isomerase